MREITKKELMAKLKILEPKDKKQRDDLVCSILGHSRISTGWFGYRYCARCSDQLGDSLGSIDLGAKGSVLVGHNCKECRKNYKQCTWRDKLYCPDPFKNDK